MARRSAIVFCCLCWFGLPEVLAQSGGSAINTFGYFQVLFQHAEHTDDLETNNSFSVQQLNLIFQKDFSRRWLAFINFEVLNNFRRASAGARSISMKPGSAIGPTGN